MIDNLVLALNGMLRGRTTEVRSQFFNENLSQLL
jgi:hypothetical protein